MMDLNHSMPTKGRAPLSESLPTLIQQPITKLQRLSCIAGVTTGTQQDNKTMLRIQFRNRETMNCNAALQCFAGQGLSPKHLQISMDDHYMMIQVSTSKFLSN